MASTHGDVKDVLHHDDELIIIIIIIRQLIRRRNMSMKSLQRRRNSAALQQQLLLLLLLLLDTGEDEGDASPIGVCKCSRPTDFPHLQNIYVHNCKRNWLWGMHKYSAYGSFFPEPHCRLCSGPNRGCCPHTPVAHSPPLIVFGFTPDYYCCCCCCCTVRLQHTISEAECVYHGLLIVASVGTHDTGTGKSRRLALSLQGWCLHICIYVYLTHRRH